MVSLLSTIWGPDAWQLDVKRIAIQKNALQRNAKSGFAGCEPVVFVDLYDGDRLVERVEGHALRIEGPSRLRYGHPKGGDLSAQRYGAAVFLETASPVIVEDWRERTERRLE